MSATDTVRPEVSQKQLRATIETLAAFERRPHSRGEKRAAEWIVERLAEAGCEARVEEELSQPYYARPMAALSAAGVAAGYLAVRGGPLRRAVAAVLGTAAAAAIAEDASNGPRLFRRAVLGPKTTWNAVAEAGDPAAERTLVLLAHHDASNTGLVFDQSLQRTLWQKYPDLIERTDTGFPMWWTVVSGPVLAGLAGLTGRRTLGGIGAVLSALATAGFLDIAARPVVPGANDNLSGVAVMIAFAEELRERPIEGLRVLMASCGSEEVLQGGIIGFAERHLRELPPDRTWVVNNDSVGSPRLALLEGEGPFVMEDFDEAFKDMIEGIAAEHGIELRRGLRARLSTDSVIPHRAGYPVASFVSVNAWKSVSNYHWPTDTPENVDYSTVADSARLTRLIAERLAAT